jgi:hypothetical protein
MRCNQRFFGQESFERGTAERERCIALAALKPAMAQYGFALRDRLPELPADTGGLVQVKYNGMLAIVVWDEAIGGFAVWNPRGRRYFSLPDHRTHPITDFFNAHLSEWTDTAFVGETYVVRRIDGKRYMTEFNRSMSIIKNPRTVDDVRRIQLAVFDYAHVRDADTLVTPAAPYRERFEGLRRDFGFAVGCDSGVVHLPDYRVVAGTFQESAADVQAFWDEFVGERRFEGVVLHTDDGQQYKVKFRDTLDVAIVAFRMRGTHRPVCDACGAKFDSFWLRKLAKDGAVRKADWFDTGGRLLDPGATDAWWKPMAACPLCGGAVTTTAGPILGAKVALMTTEGHYVDVADGAQLSPLSPILDLVTPLYEADGYLWVAPELVVEVSYQGDQLHIDRTKPVYRFEDNRYVQAGSMTAVSLRPYRIRLREDKTVNPKDLRLEQLNYFVDQVRRLRERWHNTRMQDTLHQYLRQHP